MLASLALLFAGSRLWVGTTLFATLTNPVITESSGVGVSRAYAGVFYTHNDSGDSSRIFRFRKDGNVSIVNVNGAANVDWEDMECQRVGNRNLIYIADTGDNSLNRSNIKVYKFDEPNINASSVSLLATYTLTYPDGAHNCEALIVDPATGDLYFATKGTTQCDVYRLAAPATSGTYALTKLGTIHPNTGGGNDGKKVTSGDTDGRHVMLRTLTGALEYTISGSFQSWWTKTPASVTMPSVTQGEAIGYSPIGRFLYSTSEGNPCPVHRMSVLESINPHL